MSTLEVKTKTLSNPWRPWQVGLKQQSPCTKKPWRVSVPAASRSLPSYFAPVIVAFPARVQLGVSAKNLSPQYVMYPYIAKEHKFKWIQGLCCNYVQSKEYDSIKVFSDSIRDFTEATSMPSVMVAIFLIQWFIDSKVFKTTAISI